MADTRSRYQLLQLCQTMVPTTRGLLECGAPLIDQLTELTSASTRCRRTQARVLPADLLSTGYNRKSSAISAASRAQAGLRSPGGEARRSSCTGSRGKPSSGVSSRISGVIRTRSMIQTGAGRPVAYPAGCLPPPPSSNGALHRLRDTRTIDPCEPSSKPLLCKSRPTSCGPMRSAWRSSIGSLRTHSRRHSRCARRSQGSLDSAWYG